MIFDVDLGIDLSDKSKLGLASLGFRKLKFFDSEVSTLVIL